MHHPGRLMHNLGIINAQSRCLYPIDYYTTCFAPTEGWGASIARASDDGV